MSLRLYKTAKQLENEKLRNRCVDVMNNLRILLDLNNMPEFEYSDCIVCSKTLKSKESMLRFVMNSINLMFKEIDSK
jgi:hypothetical protein